MGRVFLAPRKEQAVSMSCAMVALHTSAACPAPRKEQVPALEGAVGAGAAEGLHVKGSEHLNDLLHSVHLALTPRPFKPLLSYAEQCAANVCEVNLS